MYILIADARPEVRFALNVLLSRQPGIEVVGEVVDFQDLLFQAEMTDPDLVLLSWELAGPETAGLLPALRKICPGLAVIALSGRSEARRAALEAGVDAFVSKADPPEYLLAAIGDCNRGQTRVEKYKPNQHLADYGKEPQ